MFFHGRCRECSKGVLARRAFSLFESICTQCGNSKVSLTEQSCIVQTQTQVSRLKVFLPYSLQTCGSVPHSLVSIELSDFSAIFLELVDIK